MNGEVKVKNSDQHTKTRKKYLKLIMMSSMCISLMVVVLFSPLRTMAINRLRGVWIMINRVMNDYSSELPQIKNISFATVEVDVMPTKDYDYITKTRQDLYQGNLILVNGDYACLLLQKDELVPLQQYKNKAYKIEQEDAQLNEETVTAFNAMMKSFMKATGKNDMIITSAYRGLMEQAEILQEKIDLFGEDYAMKWAMIPGYSEHHSGYAFDLSIYTDKGKYVSYKGQDEYGWINENCYKYGFIRRYAEEKQSITGVIDEQWHYRYIGVPHAYIVTDKNFCLEEYIEYLKAFTFDKEHLKVRCEAGAYEIYFVPSDGKETLVPVPSDKVYEVSGNNIDGFIVTVTLS